MIFQYIKSRLPFVVFVFVFLIGIQFKPYAFQLSNRAEISVITCAPGNGAADVYGHTAIRVKDPVYNYDAAFNYGIYDFDGSGFVYRFASGQTDYKLAAFQFDAFVNSYKRYKRSVYEQVLELTPFEKQKIVDFLIWNTKPENSVYRYNFFFDNCATRVRDVLANNIEGGLTFKEETHSNKTLRRHVKDYHGKLLWVNFGADLIVSSKSDRVATFWEEMFLPDYLMNHFAEAVKTADGKPVVKATKVIYQAPPNDYKSLKIISPFVIILILTLLAAYVSFRQFRRQKMSNRLDVWIYGLNGFMGVIIAWFTLFSEHPAMSPNYNLLWALPLNLLFALALLVKKWRPTLEKYHLLISIWLVLFLCASPFVPQVFHPVFYLLVIIMLCRSVFHSLLIAQKRKSRK